MTCNFRERLLSGERLVGAMVSLASSQVAEILAGAGFQWLFIDAEHGTLDTSNVLNILQAAGTTPGVVRVASAAEVPVKQALDMGAAGIIAPMVNTAGQAADVVRWAKYSPDGSRGVGLGRAHGYGASFREYMESANENTAVIVQAEHILAVENMENIVKVPGVDAIFVGPYDLSASLNLIGQVDHPRVQEAIAHVTRVCLSAGKRLGIFGVSVEAVEPYLDQGYTLIVAGVDSLLLGQSARRIVTRFEN